MLPLLRILPVGGVLLAIMLLVLALDPPDAPRLPPRPDAARGALIERRLHSEWQQFFIQAAMQRAEELKRLLELPDSPALAALPPQAGEPEPAPPKAAGLPAERKDADPDRDETGSIAPQPEASLPVDIGEASSFELPIGATEEKPPVIRAPESARPRKMAASSARPWAAPRHRHCPSRTLRIFSAISLG